MLTEHGDPVWVLETYQQQMEQNHKMAFPLELPLMGDREATFRRPYHMVANWGCEGKLRGPGAGAARISNRDSLRRKVVSEQRAKEGAAGAMRLSGERGHSGKRAQCGWS